MDFTRQGCVRLLVGCGGASLMLPSSGLVCAERQKRYIEICMFKINISILK